MIGESRGKDEEGLEGLMAEEFVCQASTREAVEERHHSGQSLLSA